jgi:hypothetical protein
MNISIIIAALVNGLSSNPQITLQEYVQYFHTYTLLIDQYADDSAIIAWFVANVPCFVFEILIIKVFAWGTKNIYDVFRTCPKRVVLVTFVSIYIMNFLFATLSFVLLRHSETFGSHPECNNAARVFFFTTFKASHAWFLAMVITYVLPLAVPLLFILGFIAETIAETLKDFMKTLYNHFPSLTEHLPKIFLKICVCSIFIFESTHSYLFQIPNYAYFLLR